MYVGPTPIWLVDQIRFSESRLQMYLRPKTFDVCARLAQLVRSLTANPGGLGFNPWAGRGLNFTGSSHRPWTGTCYSLKSRKSSLLK